MIFKETGLAGAFTIQWTPLRDEKGVFFEYWDRDLFLGAGIPFDFNRSALSVNPKAGTLRGLHFQIAPMEEAKLVRVSRGRAFDVIVDLRKGSPTFRRWHGALLGGERPEALFVPPGFAHGFLSLEGDTEIAYLISGRYAPDFAAGLRWDDPLLQIAWPRKPLVLSKRDRNFPLLSPDA